MGVLSGGVMLQNVPGGIVSILISLGGAICYRRMNIHCENSEVRAAEKGLKDKDSEDYKNVTAKFNGPFFSSNGLVYLVLNPTYETLISSTGLGMIASSFYVMRADYLPPRKNCISRGLDKLEKILEKARQPVLVPSPANAIEYFNYYKTHS